MNIRLFDNLNQKDIYLKDKKQPIKIYNCGPTVSDYIHIGHIRNALLPDILLRIITELGWEEVISISNVTNISNKILQKSKQNNNYSWNDIGNLYMVKWQEELVNFNIVLPNIILPDTKHISSIIQTIEKLLSINAAYIKDSSVFYDCKNLENTLEKHGYTKGLDESSSELLKHILAINEDFILWESVKDDEEMVWQSPWGLGRPGKHIPCSTILESFCRDDDLLIHCGGNDLYYHHSCEFAQTISCSDNKKVANAWIYNSMVNVNEKKMGKSLGNSVTVQEILKSFSPEIIKWYLLSTSFSEIINFKIDDIETAGKEWEEILKCITNTNNSELYIANETFYNSIISILADNIRVNDALISLKHNILEGKKDIRITAKYLLNMLGFRIN
ncbi:MULTISPECIES: class I tRNA ligase family protein [Cytobacillus]|uniref:tRNA synthetases class I catalytic domain-containing protein n=1 Tax=Cytobacillus oceanisediminis TaxID=665099 RepID=A0ABX3CJM2_9BACI|nr:MULTISPECIES: class I tRNA ligase family protein [Cytobacillus]OHX40709.1 hypothetical protein BBV17_29090 [Cytobacillus oceanisediminis]